MTLVDILVSSKALVTTAAISITAFIWIKFVKTGHVFEGSKNLEGKTVIVTGANVGIGKETAVCFAKRKAKVVIACRNEGKAEKAIKDIKHESGSELIRFLRLDLSDFNSVRNFVKEFEDSEERLDILVNNAAAAGPGHNKDGYDLMLATNQLGPFLLTMLLMPIMKKTSLSSPVRIVNVSADAYHIGKIDFELFRPTPEIHLSPFQCVKQYANTKLMNIYFTSELNKSLRPDDPKCNITTYSLHPGVIDSRLGSDMAENMNFFLGYLVKFWKLLCMRSTFYGCQTTLYCALEEGLESKSGKYFRNLKEVKLDPKASDPEISRRLWQRCEEITGIEWGKI